MCDAIMMWTMDSIFFTIIEKCLMRYYGSSFAIIFCIFDFFDNFLRLEKFNINMLYRVFNQHEAANDKSNNEILLERAIHSFLYLM